MDYVQISAFQLDSHHFQCDARVVVAQKEQPLVRIVRGWRDVEDQAAVLDHVSASRAFDPMLGR